MIEEKNQNIEITPFYGRIQVLESSNPFIQQLISNIIQITDEIIKINENKNEWKDLKENLNKIIHKIIENKLKCEYYKLRILQTAILPYIRKMKTRMILNKKRFSQINYLILILCKNKEISDHPANTLLEIENVITSIKNEKNWFQSEFEIDLERAVSIEWLPILNDNRKVLQNIGGRLLIIGLIGVFRYSLFLLPIMMLMIETIFIIRKISDKSGLNSQNILQLAKVTLLMIATGIIIKLVEMLPGFGFSLLSIGSILLIISVIDPLLKIVCPYLATNIPQISTILQQLETVEGTFMNYITSLLKEISLNNNFKITQNNINNNNNHNNYINGSNRVEELHTLQQEQSSQSPSSSSSSQSSFYQQQNHQEEEEYETHISHSTSTGMRRRKL